jgi:hypothetical protein
LLDLFVVKDAQTSTPEDDPQPVVGPLGDGRVLDGQEFEALAVAKRIQVLELFQSRAGEDEGLEIRQGVGQHGGDGGDGVVGEEEMLHALERGKVGERGDGIVGEVDRLELVLVPCRWLIVVMPVSDAPW